MQQQLTPLKAKEWEAEVIIVDPVPVAWPVQDEHDNAIADQQFSRLKQMAVESYCLVIGPVEHGGGPDKEEIQSARCHGSYRPL